MRSVSFLSVTRLVVLAMAILLVAGCPTPGTDPTPTPPPTDPSKIGFEGTLTLGDYTYSNADHASGDEGMVFSADTALYQAGVQSLHVQGTSLLNQYSAGNVFCEVNIPVGQVTDFTGKTVTAQVYVPTGSTVTGVNLTFFNAAGGVWMVNSEAPVTAGGWNAVSFVASDKGYTAPPSMDLTAITKLRLRFMTGGASATVNVNVDAINW